MKTMEGTTGVIRNASQVINVHSGSQLRVSIDVSEQVPAGSAATVEIDWKVQPDLSVVAADPFLASKAGAVAPWGADSDGGLGTAGALQLSQRAVPDSAAGHLSPSRDWKPPPGGDRGVKQRAVPAETAASLSTTQESDRPRSLDRSALSGRQENGGRAGAPVRAQSPEEQVAGPPVGLGGPGNLASLGRRTPAAQPAQRGGQAGRKPGRSKGPPAPPLDGPPSGRSAERSSSGRVPSDRWPWCGLDKGLRAAPPAAPPPPLGRSCSLPALQKCRGVPPGYPTGPITRGNRMGRGLR